jgi:hypothetical protein
MPSEHGGVSRRLADAGLGTGQQEGMCMRLRESAVRTNAVQALGGWAHVYWLGRGPCKAWCHPRPPNGANVRTHHQHKALARGIGLLSQPARKAGHAPRAGGAVRYGVPVSGVSLRPTVGPPGARAARRGSWRAVPSPARAPLWVGASNNSTIVLEACPGGVILRRRLQFKGNY